jgi:hypothetical protein
MNEIQTGYFVNHGALASILDSVLKEFQPINKILLISPNRSDRDFVRKLFPDALIIVSQIYTWNLNNPPPDGYPKVDLAISSHVQMHADHPEVWIRNILSIANLYVFQDLKYRNRVPGSGVRLGTDHDVMRYTLNPEKTKQPSFALSGLPFRIHKFFEFEGIKNEYHEENDPPIHMCVAISNGRRDRTRVSLRDVLFSVRQELVIFARTNAHRVSKRIFRQAVTQQ